MSWNVPLPESNALNDGGTKFVALTVTRISAATPLLFMICRDELFSMLLKGPNVAVCSDPNTWTPAMMMDALALPRPNWLTAGLPSVIGVPNVHPTFWSEAQKFDPLTVPDRSSVACAVGAAIANRQLMATPENDLLPSRFIAPSSPSWRKPCVPLYRKACFVPLRFLSPIQTSSKFVVCAMYKT